MTIKARPIHDRIFVKLDAPEERTKSGLWLPHNGQKPKRMGVVLAVGPGMEDAQGKFIKTTLNVGAHVIFGAYAGTEIKIGEQKVRVMRESDVVGAFEGDPIDVQTGPVSMKREGAHSWYQ